MTAAEAVSEAREVETTAAQTTTPRLKLPPTSLPPAAKPAPTNGTQKAVRELADAVRVRAAAFMQSWSETSTGWFSEKRVPAVSRVRPIPRAETAVRVLPGETEKATAFQTA